MGADSGRLMGTARRGQYLRQYQGDAGNALICACARFWARFAHWTYSDMPLTQTCRIRALRGLFRDEAEKHPENARRRSAGRGCIRLLRAHGAPAEGGNTPPPGAGSENPGRFRTCRGACVVLLMLIIRPCGRFVKGTTWSPSPLESVSGTA